MNIPTAAAVGARGRGQDVAFAYGHDTKRVRLRAVAGEKEAFSKFISKPVARKISFTQFILAILVAFIQIVTISLVVGRYSYLDSVASSGAGIWVSLISAFAALQTGWCLKDAKYWKLHLSFALHIINTIATTCLVIAQFGGNIPYIRYRLGSALFPDESEHRFYSDEKISIPLTVVSLVLNSTMATAGLVQLVSSFVMTLMTGRAICCGQSKVHGKIFELDLAGEENADGVVVFKKSGGHQKGVAINNEPSVPTLSVPTVPDVPPTYNEAHII